MLLLFLAANRESTIMAYYHTVTIIRNKQKVKKEFTPSDKCGSVDEFIRAAIRMPATVRVEVAETDTQLYAYPMAQRSYPRAVVTKSGAWVYHGHGAETAWMHSGPLHTMRIA
jgi:hypothetical protein